jgi:hypothetical protein
MWRVLVVGTVGVGVLLVPSAPQAAELGGASIAVTIETHVASWPPVVVTLTNDGDEDLGPAAFPGEWGVSGQSGFVTLGENESPYVSPASLSAPPDDGDDNGDAILNVGEVWSWTFHPSCGGDFCTIDAIGYGVTSSGLVVTYPDDPEARASVFVDLLPDDRPTDNVGVVDRATGIWYLQSFDGDTTSFYYGNPGDVPFMGVWGCYVVDTPGMYRQADGYVYLRNTNTQGPADIRFFFGDPGDIPLVGDFNGNGCDTVSIYRPSNQTFYIINALGQNGGGLGEADYSFVFGNPGDKPVVGDWDNDGVDEIGLHRETTGYFYYRNTLTSGNADNTFFYGDPGDEIISGRWFQNPRRGPDTVGTFRPSDGMFYLRFSNSEGPGDVQFAYGNQRTTGVAGTFGSLPGGDPQPPGAYE